MGVISILYLIIPFSHTAAAPADSLPISYSCFHHTSKWLSGLAAVARKDTTLLYGTQISLQAQCGKDILINVLHNFINIFEEKWGKQKHKKKKNKKQTNKQNKTS